ncbi:uncharacterized protein LOC131166125 [Malania oleifera]|uniref:uncharacterized protein LOC131166125 n=1 Tax=Malania oleifera TaxID=397392 RepID=UPI0025AE16FB|nr:uncharacterized protein LOC131166125 [Malania oleifera]
MKGMKVKLLKKLKTIRQIGYVKPDRVLHANASDGFVDTFTNDKVQTHLFRREPEKKQIDRIGEAGQELDVIDVSELMRDLEDQEMEFDDDVDNKENIGLPANSKNSIGSTGKSDILAPSELRCRRSGASDAAGLSELRVENFIHNPLLEIDISSFRRPDLNSGSLFDPNLLAAFQQAVTEHNRISEAERKARIDKADCETRKDSIDEPPLKARRVEEKDDPLSHFEEKCPPGGTDSVILYTTSLRGIRKTFENCNSIRFLLESFRVLFYERDLSMHKEFKEEMWTMVGDRGVPPRLFIKGRHIGGAEEVLALHEQGKLRPLLQGIPIDRSQSPCESCAGIRFVLCFRCNGGRKIISDDSSDRCPECNENGLLICPMCC